MVVYFIITNLLILIEYVHANLNINYGQEDTIISDVLKLSWKFATKWNNTKSALFTIDSEQILVGLKMENIPIVTYSVDYVYKIKSHFLCDDINTIDYHPTIMLIFL